MKNLEILNEIYKGAKMGMDSIHIINDKVVDSNFKKTLISQYNDYKDIYDKTKILLEKENILPKDIGTPQKVMTWMGIQMNTINDKSNSQISDLLIQGTNMGVIKGIQLLHQNSEITPQVKNIVSDFIDLQQKNIDDLKMFL